MVSQTANITFLFIYTFLLFGAKIYEHPFFLNKTGLWKTKKSIFASMDMVRPPMEIFAKGFLTIAFDPSYTGESGGEPRRTASPDINMALAEARTQIARTGDYGRAGGVPKPEDLPTQAPQFLKEYADFYSTPRGFHPRSGGSTDGWNLIGCQSFLNQPLLCYAHEITNPVLLIHGGIAHSRYFSETAFQKMTGKTVEIPTQQEPGKNFSFVEGNKELYTVQGAVHTDLYDDRAGVIPYNKMEAFFKENLK